MYQIKRVSPTQTAKVVAILYGVIFLVVFIPITLFTMMTHPSQSIPWILVFAPVLYSVLGFVMTWLAAHFYNYVVQFTGGIEISLESTKRNGSGKT